LLGLDLAFAGGGAEDGWTISNIWLSVISWDLADVALFRAIASVGSLSAAALRRARRRCCQPQIAGLEAELGARLFHRTTRSLSLTPRERPFCLHAVTVIEARDSAFDSVSSGGSGLSGVLKITAPNVIGHFRRCPCRGRVDRDNPALRVDLTLSDGCHRHCDGRTGCGRSRGGVEAVGHDSDEGG